MKNLYESKMEILNNNEIVKTFGASEVEKMKKSLSENEKYIYPGMVLNYSGSMDGYTDVLDTIFKYIKKETPEWIKNFYENHGSKDDVLLEFHGVTNQAFFKVTLFDEDLEEINTCKYKISDEFENVWKIFLEYGRCYTDICLGFKSLNEITEAERDNLAYLLNNVKNTMTISSDRTRR